MDDLKWCLKIISIMIGVVLYVSIWWAMPSGVNYYKKHPDNNGWNFVYLMYKFWLLGILLHIAGIHMGVELSEFGSSEKEKNNIWK